MSGVFSSHQVTLTTQGGDTQSDWGYFSRPETTHRQHSLYQHTRRLSPGTRWWWVGMTGCDLGLTEDCTNWTNWRDVLRYSSNVCLGCGDKKCDPGFVRTPYKYRTPCGEFDNWISEILNTTNICCAAEIRSGWCCGGALTKRTQMDYLSREGEQTLTMKQISLSSFYII